jgi:2-octaprenyl-6-methoxyphenol hydroxylase
MISGDVIILGGGLVGLTLASALDSSGLTSVVIDPADPDLRRHAAFDGRTSAISSSSMRMLGTIGVAERFPEPGSPIKEIRASDGLAPGALTFQAEPQEPLGWMHENRHLRAALSARVEAAAGITLLWQSSAAAIDRGEHGVAVTLADGQEVRAPLLIVAEGRNSPTREAAGIRLARWRYDHNAIVSTLAHEQPHEDVAYEIFFPDGPFALLPMTDMVDGSHRSALVWSVSQADAPGWLSLSDADFAAEVKAAMGGFLGEVRMTAPRSTYPLGFHHAARIIDHRMALVGDAAHGIHPIAGQGLNLGLRDAAALAEVLVDGARLGLELGDAQLLERYQKWRALDTMSVAFATDSLARIYGVPGKAASAIRRFGMALIDRLEPIKERLNAEARGTSGDLPLLLRGLPI